MLGFHLFVSESLLCFARGAHWRERHGSLAGSFCVLLRLRGGSLDGFLARIVDDHAPRSNLDLALCVGHVVSRCRLEDLNFARRSPLHGAESVAAGLCVP